MAKVKSITARNGDEIIDGAIAKLEAYAKSLGLAVAREGRWVYDRSGTYLDVKLRFTVGGEDGVEAKQRKDFEMFAKYYGLENSDFGIVFSNRGKDMKLIGINSRRGAKYPYRCIEVATGKEVSFAEMAKHTIIAHRPKLAA